MIIEYSAIDGVKLLEAYDFRKFKVVMRGLDAGQPPSVSGISFVGVTDAVVEIDLVRSLRGVPDEAEWRSGYEKMLTAARASGWIDENPEGIRAHVEWSNTDVPS
jgi:hypothetical protein